MQRMERKSSRQKKQKCKENMLEKNGVNVTLLYSRSQAVEGFLHLGICTSLFPSPHSILSSVWGTDWSSELWRENRVQLQSFTQPQYLPKGSKHNYSSRMASFLSTLTFHLNFLLGLSGLSFLGYPSQPLSRLIQRNFSPISPRYMSFVRLLPLAQLAHG